MITVVVGNNKNTVWNSSSVHLLICLIRMALSTGY